MKTEYKIHSSFHTEKKIQILLLLVVIITTYFIYTPALNGPLFLDDLIYFQQGTPLDIKNISYEEIQKATAYYPSRPISILSFSANYFLNFDTKYNLKLTNLILHILVGVFIYIFLIFLLKYSNLKNSTPYKNNNIYSFMPILITTLWLLQPLSVSTVSYVTQRMVILSSLFIIISLIFYLVARIRIKEKKGRSITILYLLTSLIFGIFSCFSKEIGTLTILYIILIEIFFTSKKQNKILNNTRKFLAIYIIFSITILILVGNGYITGHSYDNRNYNLYMKLLAEGRTTLNYIHSIILPDISTMGVFLDDIILTDSLFFPMSNLYSILFILFILITSYILSIKYPLICFGIFFFFTSHLIESTVLPLEIAFEHRNYLASMGLIISLISMFPYFNIKKLQSILVYLYSIYLLFFISQTYLRSTRWSSEEFFFTTQVINHPESFRANHYIAVLLGSLKKIELANNFYTKANRLNNLQIASDSMMILQKTDEANNNKIINRISYKLDRILITNLEAGKLSDITKCTIENTCKINPKTLIAALATNKNRHYLSEEVKYTLKILKNSVEIRSLNNCEDALIESKKISDRSFNEFVKKEHRININYCSKT